MSQQSTKSFGKTLRELMRERDLSYRELALITRRLDGRGMRHAYINMLANDREKPSIRAMELLAQACEVEPEHFAEYRLAMAMRELDPTEVGLEQALENLNARLGARRSGTAPRSAPKPQAPPHPTA
jgi:transcriptional regulator with XRE-family HTH domain